MEKGYYRIHLVSRGGDGDQVTIFLPLDASGSYDRTAPKPHLFEMTWDGQRYHGRFETTVERYNRFSFVGHCQDQLTELAKAPIRVGSIVRIFESDSEGNDWWGFVVRDMKKL